MLLWLRTCCPADSAFGLASCLGWCLLIGAEWSADPIALCREVHPHLGPRQVGVSHQRGYDLDDSVGLLQQSLTHTTLLLDYLKIGYRRTEYRSGANCSVRRVAGLHPARLWLSIYGRKQRLLYCLTGCTLFVRNRYELWKGMLFAAGRLQRRWWQAEPGRCRPVVPGALLKAMLCGVLLWN